MSTIAAKDQNVRRKQLERKWYQQLWVDNLKQKNCKRREQAVTTRLSKTTKISPSKNNNADATAAALAAGSEISIIKKTESALILKTFLLHNQIHSGHNSVQDNLNDGSILEKQIVPLDTNSSVKSIKEISFKSCGEQAGGEVAPRFMSDYAVKAPYKQINFKIKTQNMEIPTLS